MTPSLRLAIVVFVLGLGVQIAGAILAVALYDPEALLHGWDTVSWAALGLGLRHPFFAALAGLLVGVVVGSLFAHLWLFQVVDPSNPPR